MRFTYTTGHRPFEGVTIKRGIGAGGFGEVYLALSDAGKEMALKLVHSHKDVELRGIRQCLNLKHPSLVHLYDLRTDGRGDHWLIMEYVAGQPLSHVLARHPDGVSADLAAVWFQEMAAGIHHLHEQGIVHRDLKPGNLFLENGAVKVGDYGLCKVLSSQPGQQTQSVGTVHYMAPEVSKGNYNRQIDVYAAGVLFYELLTGKVPFEGESAAEILMKHLTAPPDLRKAPNHLRPIIEKALAKDPNQRFLNLREMAHKVAAAQAEKNAPISVSRPQPIPVETAPAIRPIMPWGEVCGTLLLATLLAAVGVFLWAIALHQDHWPTVVRTFFLTVACSWTVLVPSIYWKENPDDSRQRRIILAGAGLAIALGMLWLDGYPLPWQDGAGPTLFDPIATPAHASEARHPFYGALYEDNRTLPVGAGYLAYFGLMFLVLRWWKLAETTRRERINLHAAFSVGFWAFMLLFLLPTWHEREPAFIAFCLSALIVQASRRWQEPIKTPRRRLKLQTVPPVVV